MRCLGRFRTVHTDAASSLLICRALTPSRVFRSSTVPAARSYCGSPATYQARVQIDGVGLPRLTSYTRPRVHAGCVARSSSTEGAAGSGRKLTLLHFNDVYNIEPAKREPIGGAARFAQKVKSFSHLNPLIVFSGDAFNPSLLSTMTLGEQMPPVLNEIGVHVACIGNHDFDFGTEQLMKLVKQCNFPWLMANVLDKETGKPYAQAPASHIMEWNGVKVGFAGLVEGEWLDTLGAVSSTDLEYVDFVEEGHRLAKQLRDEGAELLVAITHMRQPNDYMLASQVPEFDIILGGHDHFYETKFVGDVLVCKSGTDFREMTMVDVTMCSEGGKPKLEWKRVATNAEDPECDVVSAIVESYMGKMAGRLSEVIGYTASNLDGRSSIVRSRESNLGNFMCDTIKIATGADLVMINGGTFRSDTIHPAGPFTLGDLMTILPMMDGSVVLEVTGEQILAGLENSVSQYPKLEGRFAQVSGVRFTFDPSRPGGERILLESVSIGGKPINLKRRYTMATKTYVADGNDGYDVFKDCIQLVDEEAGVHMPTVIRNHFRYLEALHVWDPKVKAQKFAKKWLKKVLGKRQAEEMMEGDTEVVVERPQDAIAGAQTVVAEVGRKRPQQALARSLSRYLPARKQGFPDEHIMSLVDNVYHVKSELDGRIKILGEDN